MFQLNGKTTDGLLKQAYELASVPDNRELDVLLSSGEQISISKLCILLNELGYNAVSLTGWQAGIFTNDSNQKAIIENIDTSRILAELSQRKIVVIAGFQGINKNLDITTLGRGGSDTTAVAVAAALNAKHCFIFSDVDGVYTTDPNKMPDAKKLTNLSYIEMMDIANEGARVLHNRCVEIGEKFNIPIITKSTFNNKSGSVINGKIEENVVKSIVKNDDILMFNIYNTNIIGHQKSYDINKCFLDIQKSLISSDILPIESIQNNCSGGDIYYNKSINLNQSNCSDGEIYHNKSINLGQSNCSDDDIYHNKSINLSQSNCSSGDIYHNKSISLSQENCSCVYTFLIKSADINKLNVLLNSKLKDFNSSITPITRISIVGYGITADNVIIDKILNITEQFEVNICCINITNTKIIFTFDKIVTNELLKKLHEELF